MTEEQIKAYRKAADDGSIPDELNPLFLFNGTSTQLLVQGLAKEFSFTDLARFQLAGRGLNLKGEWVGHEKAKKVMLIHKRKRGNHL